MDSYFGQKNLEKWYLLIVCSVIGKDRIKKLGMDVASFQSRRVARSLWKLETQKTIDLFFPCSSFLTFWYGEGRNSLVTTPWGWTVYLLLWWKGFGEMEVS